MKWLYEITKNEGDGNGLEGYGYSLEIFKNGEMVDRSGAYGSEIMAKDWVRQYLELEVENNGILETFDVGKIVSDIKKDSN